MGLTLEAKLVRTETRIECHKGACRSAHPGTWTPGHDVAYRLIGETEGGLETVEFGTIVWTHERVK